MPHLDELGSPGINDSGLSLFGSKFYNSFISFSVSPEFRPCQATHGHEFLERLLLAFIPSTVNDTTPGSPGRGVGQPDTSSLLQPQKSFY